MGDMGKAERFIVRRALWARILALFPLTWMVIRLARSQAPPNPVMAAIWAVLVVAVPVLFLAGGRYWPRDRRLRVLVNDESTVAHRRAALAAGAGFAVAVAALFWLLAWLRPVNGQQALATVIDACLGATLMRFASLESAALAEAAGPGHERG